MCNVYCLVWSVWGLVFAVRGLGFRIEVFGVKRLASRRRGQVNARYHGEAHRASRCRVNVAHKTQSGPHSGLGFQVKFIETYTIVPSWLGSDQASARRWARIYDAPHVLKKLGATRSLT